MSYFSDKQSALILVLWALEIKRCEVLERKPLGTIIESYVDQHRGQVACLGTVPMLVGRAYARLMPVSSTA